ncbi:MAG: flavin reductase family protein [Bacteroidota bacterium]
MKYYSKEAIKALDKIFRLNLVNSCTGYKSANLIATRSKDGSSNVAIFNSVVHLGSDPAILGFILRPVTVPRHTWENIQETKAFTVNHIHTDMIEDAHHTSASYPKDISEFDVTGLTEIYKSDFPAPFVSEARIQIACHYLNHYDIVENGCLLVLGTVEHIYMKEGIQEEDGFLNLSKAQTVTINGLDGYALPALLDRFEYARPAE